MAYQTGLTKMIFTFRCRKCKEIIEKELPIGTSPEPPTHCGMEAQRVWASLGTRFRCSGFYQTDKALYGTDE